MSVDQHSQRRLPGGGGLKLSFMCWRGLGEMRQRASSLSHGVMAALQVWGKQALGWYHRGVSQTSGC